MFLTYYQVHFSSNMFQIVSEVVWQGLIITNLRKACHYSDGLLGNSIHAHKHANYKNT